MVVWDSQSGQRKKRPRYIKFHRDIELVYEDNQWIVRDNVLNKIVLLSPTDAFCPEMVADNEWIYYDFERDIYAQDQERIFKIIKTIQISENGHFFEILKDHRFRNCFRRWRLRSSKSI